MPRRKRFSGESMCRLLEENGFFAVRQRGSHRVMQKSIPGGTVTVPVPMHADLKAGTLASIIRQSRLDRTLFEE
ncbi:MAG: type II toxin-antitoxin system HicA family toxin [Opitutales bacterium]|nr:type II toxin-antitoxin system HicA family toxin [Opitutales bacterium]